MWRNRWFWVVLLVLSAAAALAAGLSFSRAFPIVSVDLEMSRGSALSAARDVADRHAWETSEFRQAASFGLESADRRAQTYIELEAGGRDAWTDIIRRGLHQPYLWTIRQFREGETDEAHVRFTPDGRAYGFERTLPEDEPGAALDAAAARALAERAAAEDWDVDLSAYTLVEGTEEAKPGGRVDHAFVYERTDASYGDAEFRLRLGVAGDRLAELTRFVQVPEAFTRRYSEMRSTNNMIAFVAQLAVVLLYIAGGCMAGLFLLMRHDRIYWRKALGWALVVAALLFATQLNQLPLRWLDYDTAVAARDFLLENVLWAVGGLVLGAAMLTLVFAAGEGLTRRAFPRHLRLWRLWSPGVANSRPVLGLTLGGYAFTGFFIAYAVFFYILSTRVFGWWTPSDAIIDPDLLANYVPWLSSVAVALMAGFSEEALFRAVPLAGAALLGERFGRRRLWIGAALVLQALVFAAAHANYPNQPAYARLVELLLPSIALGLVYLRFGLLPAVLAHFSYDLVWMSLPLFASSAPGVGRHQALVVLIGLTPLWIVLWSRLRHGARATAPAGAYNGAGERLERPEAAAAPADVPAPATADEPEPAAPAAAEPAGPADDPVTAGARALDGALDGATDATSGAGPGAGALRGHARRLAILAGAAGIVLWALATPSRPDAPRLTADRAQALEVARAALTGRGVDLSDGWQPLARIAARSGASEHRYVWRTAGRDRYATLLGTHLSPPQWRVRFARFDGPVDERAEEYVVYVGPAGDVRRVRHTLPEARPGPALAEADARRIAREAVVDAFGAAPAGLREVKAEANQRPERRDWTFTFADPTVELAEGGEARIDVEIAGDRVVDVRRWVYVPEDWLRADRARQTTLTVRRTAGALVLAVLFLVTLVVGVVRWSRGDFSPRAAVAAVGVVAGLMAVMAVNGWPGTAAMFTTAQPLSHQRFIAVAGQVLGVLIAAGALGLLAGLAHRLRPDAGVRGLLAHAGAAASDAARSRAGPSGGVWFGAGRSALASGLGLGTLIAGATVAFGRIGPADAPRWPDYGAAQSYAPVVAGALDPVLSFVMRALVLMVVVIALVWIGRRRGRAASVAAATVLGLTLAAVSGAPGWGAWLATGVAATLAVLAIHALGSRVHFAALPAVAAAMVVLDQVGVVMQRPYPGSLIAGVAAALLVLGLAVAWIRALEAGFGLREAPAHAGLAAATGSGAGVDASPAVPGAADAAAEAAPPADPA